MKNKPPLPREHGAWAMFFVPLLLGWLLAPIWHPRALAAAILAFCGFILHAPLYQLIKLKNRPHRVDERRQMWRWSALYAVVAASCFAWLVLAQQLYWLPAFCTLGGVLFGIHLWLENRRKAMSFLGEWIGISGLALSAPMLHYASAGVLLPDAAYLWLLSFLFFAGTPFYVRLKVRIQPKISPPPPTLQRLRIAFPSLLYHLCSFALCAILSGLSLLPSLAPLILLPVLLKSFYGAIQWQTKTELNLTKIGLLEATHSLAFLSLSLLAFLS